MIRHQLYNAESDITYVVFAPRQLTHDEMMKAIVVNLHLTPRKRKPKRGQTWEIHMGPTIPDGQ